VYQVSPRWNIGGAHHLNFGSIKSRQGLKSC
jgi:hypothetical protein